MEHNVSEELLVTNKITAKCKTNDFLFQALFPALHITNVKFEKLLG